MNIEITGETEKLIHAALAASEGLGSANDYIRTLVQEDQLARLSLSTALRDQAVVLESLAVEGLGSGDSVMADDEFWQERRQLAKEHGSTK